MSDEPVRKILLGIDFSEPARVAARWAKALAEAHGAALTVVHIHQPLGPMLIGSGVVPVPDAAQAELSEAARKSCDEFVADAFDADRCPEIIFRAGLAGPRMVEVAEETGADVLVVGMQGQTSIRKGHVGTTVKHLVDEAPCPVFVVHPSDAGDPRSVKTVVVPTDFSEDAERATRAAVRLLAPTVGQGARVVLIHAYHIPMEIHALTGPDHLLGESVQAVQREAHEELERIASALRADGLEVDVDLREGRAAGVIEAEARDRGADVVAMASHVHEGFLHALRRHTAERLLPHAPCPVLVVPDELNDE